MEVFAMRQGKRGERISSRTSLLEYHIFAPLSKLFRRLFGEISMRLFPSRAPRIRSGAGKELSLFFDELLCLFKVRREVFGRADALDAPLSRKQLFADGVRAAGDVVRNIANLEEFYDSDDLVGIYNYVLQNCSEPEVLSGVIRLADAHKSAETLSILLDLLLMKRDGIEDSDNMTSLRVLCTKAVSNYKDTSTVGALLYCLNNKKEDYKIRLACADALGRIGDKYAVAPLIDVVKDEDEKSVYVKESATFALGLLGDTSAIEPLVEIMESKQGLWDKFSFLKERIVEALGKLNLNNTRVLKVLKQSLMDSSPMVRINAIEALMNSEYDEAYELIKGCLEDEDDEDDFVHLVEAVPRNARP